MSVNYRCFAQNYNRVPRTSIKQGKLVQFPWDALINSLQTNEHLQNAREEENMKDRYYNEISEAVAENVTTIYNKKVIFMCFENQMGKDRKTNVTEK